LSYATVSLLGKRRSQERELADGLIDSLRVYTMGVHCEESIVNFIRLHANIDILVDSS